jgi:hypothetical protein
MLNTRALMIATLLGTVLQVAMVVLGHSNTSIANLFAVGGMGISLLAGALYTWTARGGGISGLALGGLIAGGACAFIGILVSYLYGDVPATLLLLGTVSSLVTGALGGWLGRFMVRASVVPGIAVIAAMAYAEVARAQTPSTVTNNVINAATRQATVADFAWLVGKWEGKMDSRVGTAYVVYSEPHAGIVTGVMHLVSRDNKILVVELITLVDTPRGVDMRFRHFSPGLDAYETEFKQSMLLTSHEADRDVFQNQVPYAKGLLSTQPRTTSLLRQRDGSFIGRSDITGEDGKPSVIQGTYRRIGN